MNKKRIVKFVGASFLSTLLVINGVRVVIDNNKETSKQLHNFAYLPSQEILIKKPEKSEGNGKDPFNPKKKEQNKTLKPGRMFHNKILD